MRNKSNQNPVDTQEAANAQLSESPLEGYNTRGRAKQPVATEDEGVFEIDGVVLDRMETCVGSTWKSEAVKLAKAERTFSDLSDEA